MTQDDIKQIKTVIIYLVVAATAQTLGISIAATFTLMIVISCCLPTKSIDDAVAAWNEEYNDRDVSNAQQTTRKEIHHGN